MTRIGMALDPDRLAVIERRRDRRRRFRPVVEVVIGVVALAQLGGASWMLSQRSVTTEVAVDDVLADFRAGAEVSGTDVDAAPAAQGVEPAAPVPVATAGPEGEEPDAVGGQDVATSNGETTSTPQDAAQPAPAGASESPPAPAGAAAAALALPAEGVWTYETAGGETLSLGGARHDYPEQTFLVVEHAGGCGWTADHRIVEEHRVKATYCTQDADLLAVRYQSWITFYGSTVESDYSCDRGVRGRAADIAGTIHTGQCTDGETTTTDRLESLGTETIAIGGVTVEALRYRMTSELRGEVEGESRQEIWLHPDTALPLRIERFTRSEADEFGARVTYTEDATFQLASLTPRT